MRRVVLTGGPGGGKSTLMRELRLAGEPWLMVPEAAPLLFHAGLDSREKRFQRAVVRLQLQMEDACEDTGRPQLCHRGALDALAYWMARGWPEDEFFAAVGEERQELLSRYDGVLHLVTAADGAEAFYLRWPDAHRPESASEAIHIDSLCVRAWADHPHYVRIASNANEWAEKARKARDVLRGFMSLEGGRSARC